MRKRLMILPNLMFWFFALALILRPVLVCVHNSTLHHPVKKTSTAHWKASSSQAPLLASHQHALKKNEKQTQRFRAALAPIRRLPVRWASAKHWNPVFDPRAFSPVCLFSLRI